MTERMSAAQYSSMIATAGGSGRSGGRMLRLPADFVQVARAKPAKSPASDSEQADESPRKQRISSAQKARERVAKVVDALETSRIEVDYRINDDGTERALIRVVGGETLPPNRAANIGREVSKLSQRTFSRYKHACADRMQDAATLLQQQVIAAGNPRFNAHFRKVRVSYGRQVVETRRLIDEDAVGYSFKYLLDGVVRAGMLVDDSRKYVRMGEHIQRQGSESVLLIVLETMLPEAAS
ncbi:hypothetical protein [Paracidovorax wautersii]|uniref:Uncharacterized protein n=1 Tax=Paracidovorax wautersii TaxID=1177982 RepID=A0A1I2HVD0_9BURK|nr:hypothetical protein [Paracidovorax wautersii]SFF33994.1 hypothetical protein SAMN04489711_1394 [Paracidovorax wautersii]